MAESSALQASDAAILHTRLDTIPAEVRAVIYAHLCNRLCLVVSYQGKLDIRHYPWQLNAVSRLIRREILPTLLGKSLSVPLQLVCEKGRFPDRIRRRLPNRILDGVSIITYLGALQFDDLKPSLTTFPNLREFQLVMKRMIAPPAFNENWMAGRIRLPLTEQGLKELISDVKTARILLFAATLKLELEMPREGLERDYIVDGTLYQVASEKRRRRGFDITLEANLFSYTNQSIGTLRIDDWDAESGTLFQDAKHCKWISWMPELVLTTD